MKELFHQFDAQARHQIQDSLLRSRIIAAAVATAIAQSQPLPSSEVAHASEYFTNHVMPAAMSIISEFNESIVFDTAATLDQTRMLWQLRYFSAYRPNHQLLLGEGNFFTAFTGIDVIVSDNFYAFMNSNAAAVVNLSLFATDIIRSQAAAQVQAAGVAAR